MPAQFRRPSARIAPRNPCRTYRDKDPNRIGRYDSCSCHYRVDVTLKFQSV